MYFRVFWTAFADFVSETSNKAAFVADLTNKIMETHPKYTEIHFPHQN